MTTTIAQLLLEKDSKIQTFVSDLESCLESKVSLVHALQSRLTTLQEDFLYNLSLLQERDAELERLETTVLDLKTSLGDRDARISDIKGLLEEKNADISSLRCTLQSVDLQHQEMLRGLKREYEMKLLHSQSSLSESDHDHFNQLSQLNAQLTAKDLEIVRLQETFQERLQLADRKHLMELSETRVDYETKLKECQLDRDGYARSSQELLMVKNELEKSLVLEKEKFKLSEHRIKELEWDVSDLTKTVDSIEHEYGDALVHAKGTEERLLKELQTTQERHAQEMTAFEKKRDSEINHLDTIIKGLSKRNDSIKNDFNEQSLIYQAEIRELENQLNTTTFKLQQLEMLKEADQKARMEMDKKCNADTQNMSMELEHYRDRLTKTSVDLEQKSAVIDQLRIELARQIDEKREQHSLNLKNELEWDRKMKDLAKRKEDEQTALLQGVMQERDEYQATVKLLRAQLDARRDESRNVQESESLVQTLETEKEQHQEYIRELETKIQSLTEIIHQMRTDMENLQADMVDAQTERPASNPLAGHLSPSKENMDPSLTIPDLVKDNEALKKKLDIAGSRLRKLMIEKNRLVDMSNSMRAHVRNWKETQENRVERSCQTPMWQSEMLDKKHVLSSQIPMKKSGVLKQSEKQTQSQLKVRTKLSAQRNMSRSPVRFQEDALDYAQSKVSRDEMVRSRLRSRGIRNWNETQDI